MAEKQKQKIINATLAGSVEWETARDAAFKMLNLLSGEISALTETPTMKDAYSPVAWLNICRQLRVVTDGMITMRMLAEGKTNEQIMQETEILTGSIAAYKAWNTMYGQKIEKKIKLRMEKDRVRQADLDFLKSIGISVEVPEGTEVAE